MSLDPQQAKELARLTAVYRDQPDAALLNLWDGRTSLTEAAQQALEAVIAERGLEAENEEAPEEMAPPSTSRYEQLTAAEREILQPGEVIVHEFGDTFDLNRAVEALKRANVEYRIHNDSDDRWVPLGATRRIGLVLIAKEADELKAKRLVTQSMGLEEVVAENPFAGSEDFVALGSFHRGDALLVATGLAQAGISFTWYDPGDDAEAIRQDEVNISVRGVSHERAEQIAEETLRRL